MEFCYGPDGNRLLKIVKTKTSGVINPEIDWTYTYYVRDAQGSIMATYDIKKQGDDWQMGLDEFIMYGSNRLGVVKNIPGTEIIAGEAPVLYSSDGTGSIGFAGLKLETLVAEEYALLQPWQLNYEIDNFRGDAHVIVTADSKTICDGDFMAYAPQIQSATDMYSFGMEMPERTDVATAYRFGFNGQEKDTDIAPNITTALFWEYDSRIARRWNLDPKPQTNISDYACFINNPILFVDILGDKAWIRTGFLGLGKKYEYKDGTLFDKKGNVYKGTIKGYLKEAKEGLDKIRTGGAAGQQLIKDVQDSDQSVIITKTRSKGGNYYNSKNNKIHWSAKNADGGLDVDGKTERPSFIGLAHELAHFDDKIKNKALDEGQWFTWTAKNGVTYVVPNSEKYSTKIENKIRAENHLPLRKYYTPEEYGPALIIGKKADQNILGGDKK